MQSFSKARCLHSVTYIKFVVEQPDTVGWKIIHSIDQSHFGDPRKNYLNMLYICAVILLKGDVPNN